MMRAVLKAFLLLVGLGTVVVVALFIWIGSRGISARAEPGRLETAVARTMRRLAIPRGDRNRQNPVTPTPEIIAAGMAHYADHCAACHANDGSGETQLGRGLYPKALDMRLPATQALTDGELFYIIENGVRLTGMPAWGTGTPEDAEETWHLVHFIRHLLRLTEGELEQMKALNPRPPGDIQQSSRKSASSRAPATRSPHQHRITTRRTVMSRQLTIAAIFAAALLIPAVAPAHEGHAHKVMGTVVSVEGSHVMVKTTAGKTVMVMLDGKTKITQGKTKIDAAALKVGDRVVAEGRDEKGTVWAATVKVGAVPAAARK